MIISMLVLIAALQTADSSPVAVSGTGVDRADTAVVHSKVPTPTGLVQRSTEIVELNGDLKGKVLYHVTSTIDLVNGTLVNTGEQVFSGTILDSDPVLVHDDRFRFEVKFATGEEAGQVFLYNHIAGPKVRCRLDVVGTGPDAAGNPTFTYTGECRFRGW